MTRSLRLTQYVAFVGLGLSQGIVGPLLPSIQAEVAMSDWRAGLFGSGQFIGILVTGLAGGYLADRFGKKAFVLVASALLSVGLWGYTVAGSFWPLLGAAIVTGLGGGGYEVGVNALQADHADAEGSGHGMSLLHAFYGIGAVGGPFAVQVALHQGLGWRPALWVSAVTPLAVAALLWPQRIAPGRTAPAEERAGDVLRHPTLWICGLVFLAYVGVEMSMGIWIPTYWARRAPGSAVPAPLLGAVFWGTLTAARFVVGLVADRIGHLRFLILAALAVILLGVLWSIFDGPTFSLLAVMAIGAALAGVYPTAMAWATDRFPGRSGVVVGLLSVFVALGGFLLPAGLGRLSDTFGIGVLPAVVVGMGTVLLAMILALRAPWRARPEVTPAPR
jgi:fucose permease